MRKLYSILLISLSLTSCEKALFENDLASTNPKDNFEYLWNECNEKYSYFDVKNIDWDVVKSEYAAKIYDGMSEDSLFNVLGGMLTELRDDHTNLISNFNVSTFRVDYLGQDNFDWRIIEDHYLNRDYYITGPFLHNFLDNKEIGYVRFPSFPGTVDADNLNFVLNRYKNTKGLILDMRENGGGAVTDIFAILSRFVERKTLVNYSRIKSGPGRNDFSAAEPVYVSPYSGIRYKNKIVVLVDRGTYSAGSFFSLATKALPNITLIGDTTGGGLGLPNGGQLPNGWTYRFSITQALTLDKNPDYENGVPPDIEALIDWSDLTKDEVLERAILELQ
ncbi:C-terminal processing protease CtpA/Prc [Aquimarina sp. EL_43]|uniref:S41 family peptidase n=1 Tax=unclassified Aquimarina TaxID=2627091 RepID=UPI0018CBECF5|nr:MULTISPECIES: S41 family peptidase [unclassified Aquimarina]MBG6130743.1 C-terminal processing protease CtpA/Prc [Aquimarina sp. EL_35]MBG6151110.1 C-terminal processing protease CtpA/Prc [Aquimarina sp. EL_32]MBG6169133.1 C-terminal processing protease CtpA/Prc [Aquimarina sp. EL_43]